ncbi:MAG TPA: extracellular solute-binding protein [Chloroflexota bacterium]|nr:extracellular solute-binding protein [Chloroflexota bacterium]
MIPEPRARFLGRRGFLKWSTLALGLAAAAPVLQACGAAAPTATPAAGAAAPKPSDKPAEKPAAPTNTPAAAAKPTEPSAPAAKPAATKPADSAKPGPAQGAPGTPAAKPAAPAPQPTEPPASEAVRKVVGDLPKPKSSAKITGKFTVIQHQDFHPDHNSFVRLSLEEWAKANSWPLDISYTAGFTGGGDLNQKLVAMVQAGTSPDLLFHDVGVRQLFFLEVVEDVTKLAEEMQAKFGKTGPGYVRSTQFEGKWWGVPFYTRTGGYYLRTDWFKDAGLDPEKDTETYNKLRETALKLSDPDKKKWGWGMTVNRSGDGESMVQNLIHAHGGRLQDKSGQVVTLNSPETIAGMEWLKETYTDQKWAKALPPGVNAWNDISNNEAFLAGTIGITQNAGTMLAKAYFDKVPHAESILFVETPKSLDGKGPRLSSGAGDRFHILKGSKNREAAEDTIRFMLTDEYQKTIWSISKAYALPAYAKGWEDPIVKNFPNSIRFKPIYDNEDWWGLATPGPLSAAVDAVGVSNMYTDAMGEILKGKPVKQVAEEMHKRAVRIFKEFGLKGE